MTNFTTLDPETRAYALVGKFLFKWALMEGQIKSALGKALDLDNIKTSIIVANIQFRDKIHILRTALHYADVTIDDRDRLKTVLQKVANYSAVRNMMAHEMFGPAENGGVEFLVIKAKGEIKLPKEEWSVTQFEEAYKKLDHYSAEIKNIRRAIDYARLSRGLLTSGLQWPTGGTTGPGLLADLLLQPPNNPDSEADPSNEQTTSQTLPSENE